MSADKEQEQELVYFGQFDLNDAKLVQLKLKELGIHTEIRGNEKTCTTQGCKVPVDMFGHEKDVAQVSEIFRKEFFKNIGNAQVNFEAMAAVFDPNAETVTCQACATKFSPNLTECPDCGLCYG